MKWKASFYELLAKVGLGTMPGNAYDTGWYARLAQSNEPFAYKALDWLRAYQLPDGTWGSPDVYYAQDRIISTLSAINTLQQVGNGRDQNRLKRAQKGLSSAINTYLSQNGLYELAGFEVIAPTLLAEADSLGLMDNLGVTHLLPNLIAEQKHRLKALRGNRINNQSILAYSAEMAGNNLQILDLDTLQMDDGSVYFSPAATSFFYLSGKKHASALGYLDKLADERNSAMPNVFPFAVFERAWTLWSLDLMGELDVEGQAICAPILDKLEAAWEPGRGVSFTDGGVPDGDDTSLAYEVLIKYGRFVDREGLLYHFAGTHMRCNQMEANPSISANAHAIGALRATGFAPTHPIVQRVAHFLQSAMGKNGALLDKWHVSPYYPTCHAIVAATGYLDWLVETAVSWLTTSQHKDGSWGSYLSTAEETAYAIQALAIRHRDTPENHFDTIQRGANWLLENYDGTHPALWIGKVLYSPTYVNDSAVYSALCLAEQIGAI